MIKINPVRSKKLLPKRFTCCLAAMAAAALTLQSPVIADTVYLKNGNKLEGFVEKEDGGSVEVNMGFGYVTLLKSEIEKIIKSSPAESQKIWDQWNQRKKDEDMRRPQLMKIKADNDAKAARLAAEESALKIAGDEYGQKEVGVATQDGHFFVNVLLNGKIRAKLILDSGASCVALPKRISDALEIDFNQLKKDQAKMADGRVEQIAVSKLQSIEILSSDAAHPDDLKRTGIIAENVDAFFLTRANDVITENADRVYTPDDGLLGMSFLKHFQIKLDYENKRIFFQKNRND